MEKIINYFDDETRLEGIFFPCEENENAPVVLVVPTYAGRDQFTIDKAKSMNALGYSGSVSYTHLTLPTIYSV